MTNTPTTIQTRKSYGKERWGYVLIGGGADFASRMMYRSEAAALAAAEADVAASEESAR